MTLVTNSAFRALLCIIVLVLQACATHPVIETRLDDGRYAVRCTSLAITLQDLTEALAYHVIQIDPDGRYSPTRYSAECHGAVENGEQPRGLEDLLKAIRDRIEGGAYSDVLIYLHGGLVGRQEGVEQAMVMSTAMRKDPELNRSGRRYYPLMITWRSGGMESYGEQLLEVRNGEINKPLAWATAPMKLGSDLGTGLTDTLFAAGLEGDRLVDSLSDKLNACTARDHAPLIICPEPRGFSMLGTVRTSAYLLLTPARIGTAPLINGLGRPAWENMLRHTRSAFLRDAPAEQADLTEVSSDGLEGAVYRLFEALGHAGLGPRRIGITLIGHSMGTILISEAVRQFPDLPYDRIVFMAPAVSIRDFASSVIPVLADPNRGVRFYELSLLPVNEARERTGGGLLPSGSLLEWVDEMYESPATLADRTLGKWVNARRLIDYFPPPARARMTFRVFGDKPCQPQKHGEFNDLVMCFWREAFWTSDDRAWPHHASACARFVSERLLGREAEERLCGQ
jgi:pimeloyl-ACP methyl ester carboxylesterase